MDAAPAESSPAFSTPPDKVQPYEDGMACISSLPCRSPTWTDQHFALTCSQTVHHMNVPQENGIEPLQPVLRPVVSVVSPPPT